VTISSLKKINQVNQTRFAWFFMVNPAVQLLVIENVGNLVYPTSYNLGKDLQEKQKSVVALRRILVLHGYNH
jgi:Ni2+-binding GTPase involved in maturation of urease and hydrogenase